jgi:Zn finger protein HypA/HybF involved in hydrogenase expression
LHELSLVQGIVDAVQETAKEGKGNVSSFTIKVGELSQFDIHLIRQLLVDLRKGTPLETAKVFVEQEKCRVRCLGCGKHWDFQQLAGSLSKDEKEMVHFLPELLSSCSKCPSCSSSYFDIEAGRSVRVAEVVLDA